ncbi:alpha-galactosidase [Chitinophaga defluvii]|uniref:Alpha-galactosidase n=1 Tax=Chitinophaga defluvii TaxID=3163343 RepID=A0ABV2TB91_9BACT
MRAITQSLTLLLLVFFKPIMNKGFSQNHVKFEDCGVWLVSDTLTIGNSKIERRFLWNNGNLISLDITNRQTGKKTVLENSNTDFSLPGKMHTKEGAGVLETKIRREEDFSQRRLDVIVLTKVNALEVKRVFRIYPGIPAIACDYYFKGEMDSSVQLRISSPGDLVNVENISEVNKEQLPVMRLDRLGLSGNHWKVRAVQFFDITDRHTTTVKFTDQMAYIFGNQLVGNLLLINNGIGKEGLFWLKEAPSPSVQHAYPGFDFSVKTGSFQLTGAGIERKDISPFRWVRGYGFVIGVSDGSENGQVIALREYQQCIRKYIPARDDMVMMNTWGERGEGENLNEAFALNEIRTASKLGVNVFQLDAGWYQGGTKNMDSFWLPHKEKFPNGLAPLIADGRKSNVEISLWYEPDPENDYAHWERDAGILTRIYNKYGIKIFKIDGVQIISKEGEVNFRKFLDSVLNATDNKVFFNIDITAGRRNGYHYFNEYGNLFLENRYTDWGNYYPYQTLRNTWNLSKYFPLQKLLVEFLNTDRNRDQYPPGDIFAPANIPFEYTFAITMMAQPLAWLEAHRLSSEQLNIAPVVTTYRKYQHDIHSGSIFPIGQEPDGQSWTGFQSIQQGRGYIIVYRENNNSSAAFLKTFFAMGTKVSFRPLIGKGKPFVAVAGDDGRIRFSLPSLNSYALYEYKIQ